MKIPNKILVFLFLVLAISLGRAQSNWFWQNPHPQGYSLQDGKFLNPTTGFAVGRYGTIIKTTDGGSNWTIIYSDTSFVLYSVDIVNSNAIFVAGTQGTVFKSTDLGASWINKSVANTDYIYDVDFTDENIGYIVGNKIYKTSDGGNNWTEQVSSMNNFGFRAVYFVNANTGTAIGSYQGNDLIYKTTNGGINWISYSNQIGTFTCEDVFYVTERTGYIATQHDIYKTTNSGVNWSSCLHYSHAVYYSVWFTSSMNGFAVGRDGLLSRTYDGGKYWYSSFISNYATSSSVNNLSLSISFSDSLNGFITGDFGLMLITTDGGNSWLHQRESIKHLYGTFFLNINTGYVCGQNGTVMKTTNGGSKWNTLNTGFYGTLFDMYFFDVNTGVAVGDTGVVLRTTNGGNSWTRSLSPTASKVSAVSFVNSNYGIAGCASGIIRTTNGGISWISNSPGPYSILDVSYFTLDTAYANSASGLYRSVNRGQDWTLVFSAGTWREFFSLQFFNSNTGIISRATNYIVNAYKLCKTTNGGLTFDTSRVGYRYLNFINENIGFGAGGVYNKVSMTTNGGTNWISLMSYSEGISNQLNDIFAINSSTAFVVGDYGAIMKINNIITQINTNNEINALNFLLYQNYPNPFNPETKISYSLPNTQYTILKVYNELGSQVADLVNERQLAGNYEISFNASELPSGVYFYQLVAGNTSLTKKMLLVK